MLPQQQIVRSLSKALLASGTVDDCRPELEALRRKLEVWPAMYAADRRRFQKLLDEILNAGDASTEINLPDDEFGRQATPALEALEGETREPWLALVRHCAMVRGSTPSKAWRADVPGLIEALGEAAFVRLAAEWFGFFATTSATPPRLVPASGRREQGSLLDDTNTDLLRGLAWSCHGLADRQLAAGLADAAIQGFRKLPGHGPRSVKVGKACLGALRAMPGLDGASQLERLRQTVKQPSYQRLIEEALATAAERAGMSRDDLEEMTVPDFDLQQGVRSLTFGEARAELVLQGTRVELRWYGADGKPRKSVPAAIKRDFAAEVKELKRLQKDMAKMLGAQRDRLERLPLAKRSWSYPEWRERYPDHPLIGGLARSLIWQFQEGDTGNDGFFLEDRLVDADGRPLEWLSDATEVRPWHPVYRDASEILAWRTFLEGREITQPFKQAHREIYLLTEAERSTGSYSNRFAAHILRQHQFNGLCAARGWRNTLRLMVDDDYPPASLELPTWGFRAEFWVEGTGEDFGVDTNDAGTYLYLSTDQVRFYRQGTGTAYAHAMGGGYHSNNRPVPLEQIPPLVFSEVMRDVDLFVGVASVGNDPTWQDGGPNGRYRDYWHSFAFGDLGTGAQSRREILEGLIPRLSIAERCSLEGRFLRVRGDLRSYRIHLGSSNILMEPNNQYLCIVPGRGQNPGHQQLFLPFEGDRTLAVILSKAFMLADDKAIEDPTIVLQIRR